MDLGISLRKIPKIKTLAKGPSKHSFLLERKRTSYDEKLLNIVCAFTIISYSKLFEFKCMFLIFSLFLFTHWRALD